MLGVIDHRHLVEFPHAFPLNSRAIYVLSAAMHVALKFNC